MQYFNELKRSMKYLSNNKKVIFLGQAVQCPGTAISETLKNINKKKLLELPVAEEMQMGLSIGLMMKGYVPVSIYPRWNFLLLAINQLVNHLDKLSYMTNNFYKSKIIIRTSVGSKKPLNPQSQHIGDFSNSIQKMLTTVKIVKLYEANQIFIEYSKALKRRESTILVEFGDYYNEK